MALKMLKKLERRMIQKNPDALFVFGDNLVQKGFGGQAKEARGEKNSVGIPTKRLPSMSTDAFFSDADYDVVFPLICAAFEKLRRHVSSGGLVYYPEAGVGTGLADLKNKAPMIYSHIQREFNALKHTSDSMQK